MLVDVCNQVSMRGEDEFGMVIEVKLKIDSMSRDIE